MPQHPSPIWSELRELNQHVAPTGPSFRGLSRPSPLAISQATWPELSGDTTTTTLSQFLVAELSSMNHRPMGADDKRQTS